MLEESPESVDRIVWRHGSSRDLRDSVEGAKKAVNCGTVAPAALQDATRG